MNDDPNDRLPLRTVADLRGLETEDASGVRVGRVWGALAEADTGLLRYLDLQLERSARHVLVPIGHARLREATPHTRVRLRAALLEELEAIPAYVPDAEHITDPYERALLEAHGRAYHGERYYAHPAFDHSGLFAGEHPIVRAPTSEPLPTRLVPLCDLPDYRVAEGEPDIRGWEVIGAAHDALGTVQDLIVDPAAEKVRYLVVDHDGREVALPIGLAQLDDGNEQVRIPSLSPADLTAVPGWTGGALERTDEEAIRAALHRQVNGRRRYQLPDFAGSASAFEERGA